VAMRAAFREPQRPWLFALAVLIHAGLFQLLVSQRQAAPQFPERRAVLVLLPEAEKPRLAPPPVAPVTLQPPPELSLPASTPPLLVAPPRPDATTMPPVVDWQREAEETSRKQALAAEAQRDHKDAPTKAKPEFGWDRSRVHRVESLESGGFVVRLSDRCVLVITLLAMPTCKIGTKPARGDLFQHMDDAPTAGEWKDP
jgi:hypothetical protein